MSFPKDSAFGQQAEVERRYIPPVQGLNAPTRKVGQPNIVEVPERTLEGWINSLDLAENDGDVQDVIAEIRSYLRG